MKVSINQSAVSGEKAVENVERTKGRLIDGYITDKEKIKNIIKENIEYDEYVEWIELFGSDTMTVSGLDRDRQPYGEDGCITARASH